jgi:hypothetical protein
VSGFAAFTTRLAVKTWSSRDDDEFMSDGVVTEMRETWLDLDRAAGRAGVTRGKGQRNSQKIRSRYAGVAD